MSSEVLQGVPQIAKSAMQIVVSVRFSTSTRVNFDRHLSHWVDGKFKRNGKEMKCMAPNINMVPKIENIFGQLSVSLMFQYRGAKL